MRGTTSQGLIVIALVWLAAAANAAEPAVRLNGNVIDAPRHQITLAPTGLPAQIVIHADDAELPLALRGKLGQLKPEDLAPLGRGPQLRAPMRIDVKADGKVSVAEAAAPLKPVIEQGKVKCAARLTAGPVTIDAQFEYTADAQMFATLSYSGGKVEGLELVIEPAGTVDTAIDLSLLPKDRPKALAPAAFALAPDEGLAWRPAGTDVVTGLYVGSGDRGFTFASMPAGWVADGKNPTQTLERDKAWLVTWRAKFVNGPADLSGKKRSLLFSIFTHPARTRPADARRNAWLDWPKTGAARADKAVFGEQDAFSLLAGPAGGEALSAKQDLAETYPMALFRYLAGTQTGLVARLQSNSRDLVRPGMNRAPDRVVLGRALLNDIGVDCARLAHKTDAARVVKALYDFGYFAADGKTEFLPWWRNGAVIRYGEPFSRGDAFAVTERNPMARVYVSVYRRPVDRRRGTTKALVVILNESDQPVREQLYVLAPAAVWGGPNRLTGREVLDKDINFRAIPADSDWRKGKLASWSSERITTPQGGRGVLEDAEDHGVVQEPTAKGGTEVYGIIFIPAHDFRILYGTGQP